MCWTTIRVPPKPAWSRCRDRRSRWAERFASAADASGADLILLGARKSGWLRWLSADVASEVRRHTNTPIQTVSGKVIGGSTRRAATRWAEAPAADAR
ncbi:universal stress protein [Caballeronia sp. SBC2]|uniref:universal stress protein n=1 Tax=unclassified Caballeronia TaxID=2646786 RepID=UPI00351A7774